MSFSVRRWDCCRMATPFGLPQSSPLLRGEVLRYRGVPALLVSLGLPGGRSSLAGCTGESATPPAASTRLGGSGVRALAGRVFAPSLSPGALVASDSNS